MAWIYATQNAVVQSFACLAFRVTYFRRSLNAAAAGSTLQAHVRAINPLLMGPSVLAEALDVRSALTALVNRHAF